MSDLYITVLSEQYRFYSRDTVHKSEEEAKFMSKSCRAELVQALYYTEVGHIRHCSLYAENVFLI